MMLVALYVVVTFLVFVAGSVYGARAEKAAKDEAVKAKNAAVAELTKLKTKIYETAAKRLT